MEQGRKVLMSLMTGLVAFVLVLSLPMGSLVASPSGSSAIRGGHSVSISLVAPAFGSPHAVPAAHVATAAHPAMTFPRTVLVESFTGVWCIHCPAESQALYDIDHHSSHDVIAIAELHVCAFPAGSGPCLENFVPPDGTSDSRGSYYSVCGFPDVFVDGQHDVCGATNSQPQMQNEYNDEIANASAFPANVSIAQSAFVSNAGVTSFATVTSGVTGSYNEITYLMEYIGKRNQSNGYGPHDVGYVVRSTLHNGPVNLIAGSSTEISALGPLNTTWNPLNLSVVALVQENSTKIIQNSNFAPVTTLLTGVAANLTSLSSGAMSTITVHVTNSTTGSELAGIYVNLSSNNGGTFSPSTGWTSPSGDFTSMFTAPTVESVQSVLVTAAVNATGYTDGSGSTSLTVNPIYAPGIATGVTVAPGVDYVILNWTAPSTGSGGVSYDVYEASAAAGPFTAVATTGATQYNVTDLTPGQTAWFEIVAKNVAGSAPTSAGVSVTSLSIVPTGLPAYTGYWISVGVQNFSSPVASGFNMFVPAGPLFFAFGAKSYGWLADLTVVTEILVGSTPMTLGLNFVPRLATLQGTVSPAGASVTVNGGQVSVSGGSFSWNAPAGTYYVNATATGYTANGTTVTLTPGNTSKVSLALSPSDSGTGSSTNSGDNTMVLELAVVGAVFVGAAIIVLAAVVMRSRRARPPAE